MSYSPWGHKESDTTERLHFTSPLPQSFPGGSAVKNPPANAGDVGLIPGWKDPLEKEMATCSGILAWEIPWTAEPGGLQSMGLQRVGHDLATKQQQQVFPRWLSGFHVARFQFAC